MTNAEIASRIAAHLRRFEADPQINPKGRGLFSATSYYRVSVELAGNRIAISYANRLDTFKITKVAALSYLAWLDAGNVGKYEAFRRDAGWLSRLRDDQHHPAKVGSTITPDQLDRLGKIADKADNFIHATRLSVSDRVHVDCLKSGMQEIRELIRKLYVELGGDVDGKESA